MEAVWPVISVCCPALRHQSDVFYTRQLPPETGAAQALTLRPERAAGAYVSSCQITQLETCL